MPILHLLAGPNGAGKSTYQQLVLARLGLPFINADEIAAARWPDSPLEHGHDASDLAAQARATAISEQRSFVSETVFSHPSKTELVRDAADAGYLVHLHVLVVPVDLSVLRVRLRVAEGGHDVPEDKIRSRHARLFTHVVDAIDATYETVVIDSRHPTFPRIARFRYGILVDVADVDLGWLPDPLADVLRRRQT